MLTGPRGEEGDLGWKPLKAIMLQASQMWKIRDINLHLQKAEKTRNGRDAWEPMPKRDHIISLQHGDLLKTKSKEKSPKSHQRRNQFAKELIFDLKTWRQKEAPRLL